MTIPERAPTRATNKSLLARLFSFALTAFILIVLLFGVLVLYNNYSFHRPTQAEFNAQLDHSIDTATNWIVQHPDIQGNPPLMFMIGDMADMSNDPRLRSYIEAYLASPRVRMPGKPQTWYFAHWVDPSVPLPMIPADMVPRVGMAG